MRRVIWAARRALRAFADEADTLGFTAGALVVIAGVALLSVPAALIAGGFGLCAASYLLGRAK